LGKLLIWADSGVGCMASLEDYGRNFSYNLVAFIKMFESEKNIF
jgi:hypothetical protein